MILRAPSASAGCTTGVFAAYSAVLRGRRIFGGHTPYLSAYASCLGREPSFGGRRRMTDWTGKPVCWSVPQPVRDSISRTNASSPPLTSGNLKGRQAAGRERPRAIRKAFLAVSAVDTSNRRHTGNLSLRTPLRKHPSPAPGYYPASANPDTTRMVDRRADAR